MSRAWGKTHVKTQGQVGATRLIKAVMTLSLIGILASQWLPSAQANLEPESGYVEADRIRVGISDDAMTSLEYPLTQVSATGPFTISDKSTGALLVKAQAGEVVTVSVDRLGFYLKSNLRALAKPANADSSVALVGSLLRVPGPLVVKPASAANRLKVVNITRRKEIPQFRGYFEILRGFSSPAKLTVVNVVGLEDYLKAVVPNELPMRYGLEAVKAQSIAARNYAIRPREKPWKHFDICDSQLCQVYLGAQTETPGSNQAISATEGLVGIYDGEPILALFSSSHGGYAEDYSNAFSDPKTKQYPAPSIPYLRGGADLPGAVNLDLRTEAGARQFWTNPNARSFDVESPYYRWTKQWTRPELEATINKGLLAVSKDSSTKDFVTPLFDEKSRIGTLKGIRILERGVSGKAMVMAIDGSQGTWIVKKEFLIRKVLAHGGRMLPSGNVVLTPLKDANGVLTGMKTQGGGFGHGVGMSQLGASWMHKNGYAFPQIVQHYYRGVSLGSIPLAVGANRPAKPTITHFDVPRSKGMLWVQEGENGRPSPYNAEPVKLKLNGKMLTVSPSGFRSGIPVDSELRPGQLNSLVLFPDARHPERPIRAWIDLVPPVPSSTPVARR